LTSSRIEYPRFLGKCRMGFSVWNGIWIDCDAAAMEEWYKAINNVVQRLTMPIPNILFLPIYTIRICYIR